MKQKKRLDIIFCEKETKGTSHLRSWSGEQFLFFGTTAGASQSQWWHERDKVMTFFSLSMPAIFVVARMNSGYTAPDAHWEHPRTLRDRLSHSKYSLKHLKGLAFCTTPLCRAESSKNNQALHLQKCHPDTETKSGKRSDLKAWHALTNPIKFSFYSEVWKATHCPYTPFYMDLL